MKRKIEAMHEMYGCKNGEYCKTCCNLLKGNYRGKSYNKCVAYGVSHSEATDWKVSNRACGLYNILFEGRKTVIDIIKTLPKGKKTEEAIEGQIMLKV